MAAQENIYNVIVLHPNGNRELHRETCDMKHEQEIRAAVGCVVEETCVCRQCGQMAQECNQRGSSLAHRRQIRPNVNFECSWSNKLQQIARGNGVNWKRLDATDFKPFYDTSPSRQYTYDIKAPILKIPHIVHDNQDIPHSGQPQNLTQRLLGREHGKNSKDSQKQIQERWCIFDKDQEHLSQYERFEVASRCHAIIKPLASSIDAGQIWKRVSRAILTGKLPSTNSCYKMPEEAVHVFYFANDEGLVDDFIANKFGRCVKLEKVC